MPSAHGRALDPFASGPELPQMVIEMPPCETSPEGLRQMAEHRMRAELAAGSFSPEALEEPEQLGAALVEGPERRLKEFVRRGDSPPWPRNDDDSKPLNWRPRQRPARPRRLQLARREAELIRHVREHCLHGHCPPATRARRSESVDAIDDVRAIFGSDHTGHEARW